MGESAGAAALALGLAVLGGVLIVAGIRGTYRDVWAAVKAPAPNTSGGSAGGSSGGSGGHVVK